MSSALRATTKSLAGPRLTVWARCVMKGLPIPRWGNLRRTTPFSQQFGFERGTPIDRYYLMRFLDRHRDFIHGDVLEIQETGYARRYGRDLGAVHSVDIDPRVHPTFVCDLAQSETVIPSNRYDCFLMPNTLCFLQHLEACLRHALRVVRPGGVILASAPGMVPLIPDGPDYWRLSADGWREVLTETWPDADLEVSADGNCLAATAAMLGLAFEELTPAELDVHDVRYPVQVTVLCRKPARGAAR
jgi:SAM-dependent methyltransferase